ncbi:MAG TPA: GNAT family protein, partial [Polyangiaceae bacterium]|nr:GNAT family protein [Polyangiaceae bacterium]
MAAPLSTQLWSERLLLRPPRASDAAALRRLLVANAEHLRPWSPAPAAGADPLSLLELTRGLLRQRREWREDRTYAFVMAQRHEPALPIGRVTLSHVARNAFQNAYLGYWLDARQQARGLMTEAVARVVDFAFDDLKLHRVQAAVLPRNAASRRVLAKAGFREEGLARRYLQIAGRWQDHLLFGR